MHTDPILQVNDLQVDFHTHYGSFSAIRGASYHVNQGEVMAIVGESGSGKSVLTQSTVGLTPGKVVRGNILFEGRDLTAMTEQQLNTVRGRDISVVFQDAMTALNPTMRIGEQITEVLMKHFVFSKGEIQQFADELIETAKNRNEEEDVIRWLTEYYRPNKKQMDVWLKEVLTALAQPEPKVALVHWMAHTGNMTRQRAKETAIELLEMIKISDPEKRLRQYIFQFSGGMRQRIMVAIALACRPKLLIADEPTTALDVTIKAEVLEMIITLVKELNSSIILITHDLGVVASCADRIGVMYAGEFVETGDVDAIFYNAQHPYTRGLLKAIPRLDSQADVDLATIDGSPPNPARLPQGCPFHPRCDYAMAICQTENPPETDLGAGHSVRCWLQDDRAQAVRETFVSGGGA